MCNTGFVVWFSSELDFLSIYLKKMNIFVTKICLGTKEVGLPHFFMTEQMIC